MDLTSVIEDAVSDATEETPETPIETQEAPVEASPEATETAETPEPETPVESVEVASPAAQAEKPVEEDKFAKEHGLTPQMSGGRENRIPYSRVKSIVEKAQKKAVEPLQTELTTAKEKLTDYEGKLKAVGEFEQILANEPDKFLQMLSTIPAYKPFFDSLQAIQAQATQKEVVQESQVPDDMPAPDQKLADGTMVYSMDGLKSLLAWQAKNVEDRVTKQVTEQVSTRYKPIEEQWQAQEHLRAAIPHVNAQIAEARTWPLFNENEAEITQALQGDTRLSLHGAYQKIVYPKLVADRAKMREEVLREVQKAPTAPTSASTRSTKPIIQKSGSHSLEDIIREQVQQLK